MPPSSSRSVQAFQICYTKLLQRDVCYTCRRYQSTKKRGLRAGLTNYGDPDFSLFLRKAFIKGAGYTDDSLSKLVIGIINTHSAFNPCHGNVPSLIEAIKRGVLSTGEALPVEFPTISLHESFSSPTS